MDIPTDSKLSALIDACHSKSYRPRADEFLQYLAIPRIQGTTAHAPKFDNDDITAFYRATSLEVKKMRDSCDTAEGLRNKALVNPPLALMTTTTAAPLQYGHIIWTAAEPHVAKKRQDQPEYLDYQSEEDFQRSVLLDSFGVAQC